MERLTLRDVPGLRVGHVTDAEAVTGCTVVLATDGAIAGADGVMRWLAERGIGFATEGGPVPIVPAAILFDLGVGRADVRPNAEDGYAAAAAADAGSDDP